MGLISELLAAQYALLLLPLTSLTSCIASAQSFTVHLYYSYTHKFWSGYRVTLLTVLPPLLESIYLPICCSCCSCFHQACDCPKPSQVGSQCASDNSSPCLLVNWKYYCPTEQIMSFINKCTCFWNSCLHCYLLFVFLLALHFLTTTFIIRTKQDPLDRWWNTLLDNDWITSQIVRPWCLLKFSTLQFHRTVEEELLRV